MEKLFDGESPLLITHIFHLHSDYTIKLGKGKSKGRRILYFGAEMRVEQQ